MPKGISFMEFALKRVLSNELSVSRFPLQLVQLLSEKYNFRIRLKRVRAYGQLVKNSSNFNGLMGMIQRKEVDVSVTSLFYLKNRVDVAACGFDLLKYRQTFIFRHPSHDLKKRNVFLMPLTYEVWLTIVGVSICTTFILLFIKDKKNNLNFLESLLNVVGMLTQQGIIFDKITSIKGRMVICLFLLLSFVCFQFYAASIVGSLLSPARRTITTTQKLADSHLKIVLEEHPASHSALKNLQDFFGVEYIYEKKIKGNEQYLSVKEGLKKIKTGQYAFLTFIDDAFDDIKATLSDEEMQELQSIPLLVQDHQSIMYMLLAKDSPFNEAIRVGNIQLKEVGLKAYHYEKWTAQLSERSNKLTEKAVVDLNRISSIFYMLMIGYVISLIILVGELIFAKLH